MPGLSLIVTRPDSADAALAIAAAAAALGGRVRLYLHADAVSVLTQPGDAMDTARALGVAIIACQSGLAGAQLRADTLDPGVETGGLISFLADLGDDRLVTL